MSAEFVDTNVILYSLSDDVAKRRRALVILLDRPDRFGREKLKRCTHASCRSGQPSE